MDEIDYINAYKGYRKWQKLVYGMIPCRIKTAIKKIHEDGPQEIVMAIEFKRIKTGYEQYIKDIGGIQ